MAKILIVEDEKSINELMKRTLCAAGYDCVQTYCGLEAVSCMEKETWDLILLDINLPDISGWKVKEKAHEMPVIYVTARDDIHDRVRGLNQGAEDYIVKPFDLEELTARVHVVLRRFCKQEKQIRIGDTWIDLEAALIKVNNKKVELTHQEFALLKILVINKNIALTREKILDLAWGMDYYGDVRTVDVHIQRLRKKLKLEKAISTVYKYGYRLEC